MSFRITYFCQATKKGGEKSDTRSCNEKNRGNIVCWDTLCFNIAAHFFKGINHVKISSSASLKTCCIYTHKMCSTFPVVYSLKNYFFNGYFYSDRLCPAQAYISATYSILKMSTDHLMKGSECLLALGLFCPLFSSAIWEMCKGFCVCNCLEFQLKYQLCCLLFSRSALFTPTEIHPMVICATVTSLSSFSPFSQNRASSYLPHRAFTWSSSFSCDNLGWVKETRWE